MTWTSENPTGTEPMVLLPCPFCGGEVRLVEGEDGESAYVQCLDVKFHRALWLNGDNNAANEVREAWNRRAPDTEPKGGEADDDQTLQEIADGAYGDGPFTRGAARRCCRARRPAAAQAPDAASVERCIKEVETLRQEYMGALFPGDPINTRLAFTSELIGRLRALQPNKGAE